VNCENARDLLLEADLTELRSEGCGALVQHLHQCSTCQNRARRILDQAAALAAWERTAGERATPGLSAQRHAPAATQALVLTVPRLRLTRYVPEGASVDQLRQFGLGRISWTALPDRPGMVGIAGHRTTYGAPFFRLAKLERGDHILITYKGRRFDYTVTDRRIVDEGRVVTAGGVASALDLGLYLVEKFWGEAARERIAAQMEYRGYSAA